MQKLPSMQRLLKVINCNYFSIYRLNSYLFNDNVYADLQVIIVKQPTCPTYLNNGLSLDQK